MRLGIDGQRLHGQRLGIGRYIEYLVQCWGEQKRPDDQITLFLRGAGPHDFPSSNGVRLAPLAPALTGQLWQNLVLGRHLSTLDVLFCPSYTVPVTRRGRFVVATHSVEEAVPGSLPWHYHYTYAPLFRTSARRASCVIVPSALVRDQVREVYGVPDEQIVVVPQGADERFRPSTSPEADRRARVRFVGTDRPYLVFVGKLSARRCIPLLIEAFSLLVREDRIPHALLLLGPNHLNLPIREDAERLGVADRVVQDDGRFADHAELVSAYTAADAYVSASAYEGFSITMVEAMACGTPIVAMRRGAVPEVTGDAAVLVEDHTAEALADAMRRVLRDGELRATLRRRSLERAAQFRWSDIARRTLAVIRSVA